MRLRCAIVLAALALPPGAPAAGDPPATLEQRVGRLRERLAPASARLRELHGRVGAELAGKGRALLVHRDELGASWTLVSAAYALDGAPLDAGAPPDAPPEPGPVALLDRHLEPGPHRFSAELVYRVRIDAAPPRRIDVRSSHAFDARAGAVTRVTLVTYAREAAIPEDERAAVRFEVAVEASGAPDAARSGAAVP